jgi:hypothetical protein
MASADLRESALNVSSGVCLWCDRPFRTRRGGSPKRFCSAAHRVAFWSALRRWGERAVAARVLTLDQIRNADPAACTLLPGGISPLPVSESQKPALVSPAEHLGDVLASCSTIS